jgi:hypothetical protein
MGSAPRSSKAFTKATLPHSAASIKGVAGDVTSPWVDRNVVPYYKGTWGSIKRVGDWKQSISFKERRFA